MSLSALDRPLREHTGKKTTGDMGIELEIEGAIAGLPETSKFWSCKPENSLRNGVEFVLARPVSMSNLPYALKELDEVMARSKPKLSLRCSTHMHVNVLNKTIRQIYQILAYYYLVEDLLVATQGPLRIGNLFCLRMSDAEGVADMLENSIRRQEYFGYFNMNMAKYGAVNLATPFKFGSLEFRFLRPIVNSSTMEMWAKAFHTMCNRAADFPISKTCSSALTMSPSSFLMMGFGDQKFVEYVLGNMNHSDASNAIMMNFDYVSRLGTLLASKQKIRIGRGYLESDLETGDFPLKKVKINPWDIPPAAAPAWTITDDEPNFEDSDD